MGREKACCEYEGFESRPVKSECLAAPRVKGKKTFCVLVRRASWLPGHIIQGMVSVAEELTICCQQTNYVWSTEYCAGPTRGDGQGHTGQQASPGS